MTKKSKSEGAACKAYAMDQPGICQVSHLVIPDREAARWMSTVHIPGLQVHHIFGRGRRTEYSYWSNLILVENASHDWAHETGNSHSFRLACLIAKYRYGVDQMKWAEETGTIIAPEYRHWFLPSLDVIAAPKCSLLGAVSALTNNVTGIFAEYRKQLLEVLES